MNTPRVIALVGAALLSFSGLPAASQDVIDVEDGTTLRVAPVYVDDTHDRAAGLAVSFTTSNYEYDTRPRYPRARYLRGVVHAAVPFSELSIPQNVEASVWFGQSVVLSQRTQVNITEVDPDSVPPPYVFHHGFFRYGIRAQYEASSDFDEQGVAGGIELRYVHHKKRYIPSTVVDFDWVQPVHSEVRDALALDKESNGRLGLRGYWAIPIGTRIQTELDGGYFWTFGIDEALEESGWSDGPYGSAIVGFLTKWPVWELSVDEVFVGYAYGNRPTGPQEQKAWTVGLEIGSR